MNIFYNLVFDEMLIIFLMYVFPNKVPVFVISYKQGKQCSMKNYAPSKIKMGTLKILVELFSLFIVIEKRKKECVNCCFDIKRSRQCLVTKFL